MRLFHDFLIILAGSSQPNCTCSKAKLKETPEEEVLLKDNYVSFGPRKVSLTVVNDQTVSDGHKQEWEDLDCNINLTVGKITSHPPPNVQNLLDGNEKSMIFYQDESIT